MRITLVSPFDPEPADESSTKARRGGVEQVFSQVSRGLAERGHDVTMICSTNGLPRQSRENGVHTVRVRRNGTLWGAPIVNLASRIPPSSDIIHVAATYPFTTASVLRRARTLGVPSVLDFHFEPYPNSAMGRLGGAAYRRLALKDYGLADTVLIRSRAYGRSIPSLRDVPESRWRVLPNGIDPGRFHCNGVPPADDYLLFVGRLVPYKGLDVLLRALAERPVAMPLYIAGDGPLRKGLESLAADLGVDVRFLGRVEDEELPALYRGARITVLPSVNRQEAFGISLLESMACGTPVVASALPGVSSVARMGGSVARPGDPVSLAQAIHAAIEPGRLPRGGELADRIHESHSWGSITDRLLTVYDQVLETNQFSTTGGTRHANPLGDPVL